jgi:hypothetical protein
MRGHAIAVALALLGSGCASLPLCAVGNRESPVEHADGLERGGQPGAVPEMSAPSRDAARARTQYQLALLQVDPSSGSHDYRAAQLAFERFLAEYPNSEWEQDARAWRALLGELFARQADAARLRSEARRLKTDLQGREVEAARLKEETAKLKADLQRLKQIDLDFDRKR